MRQHPTHSMVTKKQVTHEDKMNLVTYVNLSLKCYIKFCYIVPAEKDCPQMLARAINFFWNDLIKKISKFYNFNFCIQTLFLSSSIIHTMLSPLVNSK